MGAFFGKGRRTGKYGTLLVATYNDDEDTFPSICKVGTGFTDESLDQLYQILSSKVTLKKNPRIVSEMKADVWFEPELVIEIVASEITQSPIHKTALDKIKEDAGLALRFQNSQEKLEKRKIQKMHQPMKRSLHCIKCKRRYPAFNRLNSFNQALIFSLKIMITCYVQRGIRSTGKA